jgi:hypothetical protein
MTQAIVMAFTFTALQKQNSAGKKEVKFAIKALHQNCLMLPPGKGIYHF